MGAWIPQISSGTVVIQEIIRYEPLAPLLDALYVLIWQLDLTGATFVLELLAGHDNHGLGAAK